MRWLGDGHLIQQWCFPSSKCGLASAEQHYHTNKQDALIDGLDFGGGAVAAQRVVVSLFRCVLVVTLDRGYTARCFKPAQHLRPPFSLLRIHSSNLWFSLRAHPTASILAKHRLLSTLFRFAVATNESIAGLDASWYSKLAAVARMDSSPIMLRTASEGSDRTRSGESAESPATAPTLYTPEAQRYNGGLVRTFGGLASDASSPTTASTFDMSKLTASLRTSTSGLSATARSFTPTNIFKSSKLAQLTAVSTPDVVTSATHAASQPGSSNTFAAPVLPAGSDSNMSKIKEAPLGRPTRYVVVFADKPEHVKVLATITVCPPILFQTLEVTAC